MIPTYSYCCDRDINMRFIHGCIIYKGKSVIAESINNIQGRIMGCDIPSVHAEMCAVNIAINRIGDLRNTVAIVVRYNRDGCLAESHPCALCVDLFRRVGVKTVYYSSETGDMIKVRVDKIDKNHISVGMRRGGINKLDFHIPEYF